jgi:uncharacterized protein YodC (DUF2158 family)
VEFKAGDVVQLKSGGPAMTVTTAKSTTVTTVKSEDTVFCTWFNRTDPQVWALAHGEFKVAVLQPYKP